VCVFVTLSHGEHSPRENCSHRQDFATDCEHGLQKMHLYPIVSP